MGAPSALPGAAPVAPRRGLAGRRAFLVLGLVVAAVLLAVGIWAFVTRYQETTDDAQVDADAIPVAARTAGQVLRVPIRNDQAVKAGDPLVILDPADAQARLAAARADLDTARARLDAARAEEQVATAGARGGLLGARASVAGSAGAAASAEAQVDAARAAIERASTDERRTAADLARAEELARVGGVSGQDLDHARAAHEQARAALLQARANLGATEDAARAARGRVGEARGNLAASLPVEARVAAARAETARAEAGVQAAEAATTLAENQLRYATVAAPFDGTVSNLSVHEGQLVEPGQAIATLVPVRTYVVANFKETQIARMRPGDRVEVEVDAFPGRTLEGRVASLSAATGARFSLLPPDNATGNFVKVVQRVPVRIEWARPPEVPLAAGLSATATVYVGGGR
jgi:membrane fusion protein (multidrug efflux system)